MAGPPSEARHYLGPSGRAVEFQERADSAGASVPSAKEVAARRLPPRSSTASPWRSDSSARGCTNRPTSRARRAASLPGGEARRQIDGIKRFGEITVDRTHTRLLSKEFAGVSQGRNAKTGKWVDQFGAALAAIQAEPAIYLKGRRTP